MTLKAIIDILEDDGPQTVEALIERTRMTAERIRGLIGNGRKQGVIQAYKKAGSPTLYAITAKEYVSKVTRHRHPVIWYTNDGCAWILPSISKFAELRGIATGHASRSITCHWHIMKERVEKL